MKGNRTLYKALFIATLYIANKVNAVEHNIDLWPDIPPAIPKNQQLEDKIDTLINKMSLAQKVGQMVQAEITWVTPADVKKYHLGSVLNGGGTFLHGNRYASVNDWVSFMDELYLASMDTSDGGLAIPVTYGIDAVHGNNKFIGATLYPHNIGLGAAHNPELIKQIGQATAKEVLLAGIDWTFAPTIAVARDDRWGRTYESYSEDPEIVALYAKEMIEGIQGNVNSKTFLNEDHIYATAKHWVGDGGTKNGVDQGDNQDSEQQLISNHASGYFPALKAGIQSIMASHNMWNGKRLHGSKYLLTEVLKGKLGFDGFIVGDWNSHAKVVGCSNDSCAPAVNAGLDMFMVVEDWKAFIDNTIAQVNAGEIPQSRIDDAVRRILRVKLRSGLFEKGLPSKRKYANQTQYLGAPEHKAIARQAVRESLVLLKNNRNILPLAPNTKVLVAGDGAENMSKQTGGWSINWTGEGNKKSDFPGATSIYDGIKTAVSKAGGQVEYNPEGEFTTKPDVAIVVFGENPYAEWIGDIKSIAYQQHSHRDAKLLESLKKQGIPVVSIFLSGRPLWMNRVINASDAFVAAWLPGTEGAGITDVIFKTPQGSINHDFKGKLSFSWPKLASQVVLNRHDNNYDPLFAYGYGLTYQDKTVISQLPTDNNFSISQSHNNPYVLMKGRTVGDWQYQIRSQKQNIDVHTSMTSVNGFTMAEADHLIQGDAKELTWQGNEEIDLYITSSWFREDLTGYLANNSALTFNMRVEEIPQGPLWVKVGCGAKTCGQINVTPILNKNKLQQWQKISIDLMCFANAGVEFERTNAPFILSAKNRAKVRISNIAYTPKQAALADVRCHN